MTGDDVTVDHRLRTRTAGLRIIRRSAIAPSATGAAMATMEVQRAVSRDGTPIAYRTTGTGPPLVLVHGTTSNHTTWDRLLPHLEPHRTLHTIDRRGRGDSGDAEDHDLSVEFDDVAAVVDRAAAAAGSPVDLLGHSYGGICAFGAARRSANVRRLVLYEGWPTPDPTLVMAPRHVMRTVADQLETGDDEAALATFYREVVHMSDAELRAYRANEAWWAPRVAAAHTIIREDRATGTAVLDPRTAHQVTMPVLLLVGAASPASLRGDPEAVAAVLPTATIQELEGQEHLAHAFAPELFAATLLAFLGGGPDPA